MREAPHTDVDPIAAFQRLFAEALQRETADASAAALATADAEGRPSVRMVLVKGVDAQGFRFFTNLGSRKARELQENPRAALCFHWPVLARSSRRCPTARRGLRKIHGCSPAICG